MARRSEDMRKIVFEQAEIRLGLHDNTQTTEDIKDLKLRGRSRSQQLTSLARPCSIEKHIVRTNSREGQRHNEHHQYGRNGGDSSVISSNTNTSVWTRSSGRYRHPISAYTYDHAEHATVPSHSSFGFQKFQQEDFVSNWGTRNSSQLGSRNEVCSSSTKGTSITASMNDELIPAFEGVKIDLGHCIQEEHDKADSPSLTSHISSTDHDNWYTTSMELLKTLENAKVDSMETLSSCKKSVLQSPSPSDSPRPEPAIGRIQQRINDLKNVKHSEGRLNQGFTSVEQKTLIESLKNEVISMRRYGHKPILDAIERSVERYDPVTSRSVCPDHAAKSMIPNNMETSTKKLKTLLHASSSIIEELWTDPITELP